MRARRNERIVETLSRRQPDFVLAMENVHKTRNLGALARTCDAVGIGEIHAIAPADIPVSLGHKSAGGVKRWMQLIRHESVKRAFTVFRERGLRIVAADVGADTLDYREVDYAQPSVVVVGTELDGLTEEAAAAADLRIKIPLKGMVDSLNVSVATGIILYEAARQREDAGLYANRRISKTSFDRLRFEWLHPDIAAYCRDQQCPYPSLDDDGEILGQVTDNRREGFAAIVRNDVSSE